MSGGLQMLFNLWVVVPNFYLYFDIFLPGSALMFVIGDNVCVSTLVWQENRAVARKPLDAVRFGLIFADIHYKFKSSQLSPESQASEL